MAKFSKEQATQFVNDYMRKAGKTAENLDNTVGNNGYEVGQVFHTTGKLEIAEADINGTHCYWPALETKEGVSLSLKNLMGVSSLNGYSKEEPVISQSYIIDAQGNEQMVETPVTPTAGNDLNFSKVYQPSTRNWYDYLIECSSSDVFKDKTVTYLGTVVKQITMKKAGQGAGENDLYKPGYKRALATKLWSVE